MIMTHIVMAHVVMADIVMAYIAIANVVMACAVHVSLSSRLPVQFVRPPARPSGHHSTSPHTSPCRICKHARTGRQAASQPTSQP